MCEVGMAMIYTFETCDRKKWIDDDGGARSNFQLKCIIIELIKLTGKYNRRGGYFFN
jgi:hypothetical protein